MRILIIIAVFVFAIFIYIGKGNFGEQTTQEIVDTSDQQGDEGGLEKYLHPLSIEYIRQQEYPGSEIVIEQKLPPGSNYNRYIASYKSDGLKIFGLLTVPNGDSLDDKKRYPIIVFNHGYIAPAEYRTTERYIAYTDAFSRNGYIVFKPDYRGHGNSEGQALGGYGSSAYTIDVLNALASIRKYKDADPQNIGMWGHSLGGYITLRNMVVSKDIKAGVIWAGVVASYADLLNNWRRRNPSASPFPGNTSRRWRQNLVDQYGSPEENPKFWNSLSANSYLADISGPIQLHHGTADASVPIEFSEKLYEQLKAAGKEAELYSYQDDDHNITANFGTAMQRSVEFFDKYLK